MSNRMLNLNYMAIGRPGGIKCPCCNPYHNRMTNRWGTKNSPSKAQRRAKAATTRINRKREKNLVERLLREDRY